MIFDFAFCRASAGNGFRPELSDGRLFFIEITQSPFPLCDRNVGHNSEDFSCLVLPCSAVDYYLRALRVAAA